MGKERGKRVKKRKVKWDIRKKRKRKEMEIREEK
jgi:hypothetical protein